MSNTLTANLSVSSQEWDEEDLQRALLMSCQLSSEEEKGGLLDMSY